MERLKNLELGSAEIIFRNFSGRGTDYNKEGDRNFSVVIPDIDLAVSLYELGWNVQIRPKNANTRVEMKASCNTFNDRITFLEQRGELEDAIFHLKVNVSYKYEDKAPKIWLIRGTSNRKELMSESNIGTLDKAELENVDLVINPSGWNKGGRTGYMAFLKEAYITIKESSFAEKYRDYYDEQDAE